MEPKFRAFNPATKDMLYSFEAPTEPSQLGNFFYGISLAPESVVMQSSGILDKNGVEMYSGDIVTVWLEGWGKVKDKYTGVIIFKSGSCFIDNLIDVEYKEPKCTYLPHNSMLLSQYELYEVLGKDYVSNYGEVFTFSEHAAFVEVIGNTMQHPHLLTSK